MKFKIYWIYLTVFLGACASITSLSGGEKDEQPPQVITSKSTPNYQVQFNEREIILEFDEWVKLVSVKQQMIISPQLEFDPIVKLRGKKVVFQFDEREVLEEGVTTIINFGDAIQDITENNPYEDALFVFSTGDEIDSLRLEGDVVLPEGEKLENVWAMLYKDLQDSAALNSAPYYLSKVSEDGKYELKYLAEGEYQAIILEDKNFNLKWDADEKIAFVDQPILINGDSSTLQFQVFDSEPIPQLGFEKQTALFQQKMKLERVDNTVSFSFLGIDSSDYYTIRTKDSLFLYFNTLDTFEMVIDKPLVDYSDTSQIYNKRGLDSSAIWNFTIKNEKKQLFSDSILFETNVPLVEVVHDLVNISDTSKIDSTTYSFSFLEGSSNFYLKGTWEAGTNFDIEFLPGALKAVFDQENQDTLASSFKTIDVEEFGNIHVLFTNNQGTKNLYFELLGSKEEIIYANNITDSLVIIETLLPNTYTVHVFEDENENQNWDTGNFMKRKQPEKQEKTELSALRANWDLETEIDLSNFYD